MLGTTAFSARTEFSVTTGPLGCIKRGRLDRMKVEGVSDVLSTRLGFVIFAGNADEVKRDLWRYVFGIDLRAAW